MNQQTLVFPAMRKSGARPRVVRPPVNVVRKPINRTFLIFVFLFTVFAILHILLRNDIQKMLIESQVIDQQIQRLAEENGRLQAELSVLTSPKYIHQRAIEELDLIEPQVAPITLWYTRRPSSSPPPGGRMVLND